MLSTNLKIAEAELPPDQLTQEFSQFVAAQMGLSFPRERWSDLLRGIVPLVHELEVSDLEGCMRTLMASPLTKNNVEKLAGYLSVGETYFFRESAVFSALEQTVLPQLIESRRSAGKKQLRFWSAGCCTGEEAYSLAILINRLIPDISTWNVSVLGTDINPGFLKKAKQGVYRDWSFRNVPAWIKQGYFDLHTEGHYTIKPSIKRLVTFDYLNLADDAYPALTNNTNAMDIIFCRNVLMYFDSSQIKQVSQKMNRSLVDGGWLIVGAAESNQQLFNTFSTVGFPDTSFYRKEKNVLPFENFQQPLLTALFEIEQPLIEKKSIEQTLPDLVLIPSDDRGNKSPESIPTPYQQALGLYEEGNYDQAQNVLIENHCDDFMSFALLARIHANQGKLSEAVDFCRLAINADKCNPGLRYLLAVILQEQGHIDQTIDSLKQVIYLDPEFVLAHFALGGLCYRRGNSVAAKKHFSNALELLRKYRSDDILPDSEGITAGRLAGIIKAKEEFA